MGGERGLTLQPTALVHEAFLKLVHDRQILLDHVRARDRLKRDGGRRRVPLGLANVVESWNLEEAVSLDKALRRSESRDRRIAEIIRLRFFAGLSIEQTAEALGVSPATVKRRWEFGRTWLFRELREDLDLDSRHD